MNKLSRLILIIALLQGIFCAAVWIDCLPPPALLLIGGFVLLGHMGQRAVRWAHGTARFANQNDLRNAGMLGGGRGLLIGRMSDNKPVSLAAGLFSVLDSRLGSIEACERFFLALYGLGCLRYEQDVRLNRAVHTAIFAPTGAGKGASLIIPWLLENPESAVVLDYKGELASISARSRAKKFRHRVVLLDPFHVVTDHPDCLNPIDFIHDGSPTVIDDARDLAANLVVRTADEREPHWNDSAEGWIAGGITAVAQFGKPENRSLQTVRDVLSNPDKIPMLIELLCQGGDMSARLGGQLAYFRDKELSSTLTSTNRHLRFLDTPAVAANTRSSSFDPRDLRKGKMTVYCILPPEHMRSQTALVRLWIGTLMRAVVQGGLQHG